MFKRGAFASFLLLAMASAGGAETPPADQAVEPPPGIASRAVPDDYKLDILIRTTIIALNQANATGNYSVLRDLAAPGFQAANNQVRLAEIFATLRTRKLDLSPILFFDPKLAQVPSIQPDGRLRITGFFDTRPDRVIFDLIFEYVEGNWRLFGLAIDVTPPEPPNADAAPTETPSGGEDKKKSKKN